MILNTKETVLNSTDVKVGMLEHIYIFLGLLVSYFRKSQNSHFPKILIVGNIIKMSDLQSSSIIMTSKILG